LAGILALISLSFLQPYPIVIEWTGYTPYVFLTIAVLIARDEAELNPLLFVTPFVVVAGSWAYWDSAAYNGMLSWNVLGLVEDYVPIFQLIVSGGFLCIFILRRLRYGERQRD
jgi:hypothetical protein